MTVIPKVQKRKKCKIDLELKSTFFFLRTEFYCFYILFVNLAVHSVHRIHRTKQSSTTEYMERWRDRGFDTTAVSFGTQRIHRVLRQTENDITIIASQSHRSRALLEVRMPVH